MLKNWFTHKGVSPLAVLVLLLVWTGLAQANVFEIRIDDLTDTPSATLDGQAVTLLPDSNGEFLHFTVPLSFTPLSPFDFTVSNDLLDFAGGPVSDRLVTHITTFLDVQFASDPATLPVPTPGPNTVIQPPVVETGDWQQFGTGASEVIGDFVTGQDTFNIFVRSEAHVTGVPEPSTLALLSIGAVGLAGYVRRRHLP